MKEWNDEDWGKFLSELKTTTLKDLTDEWDVMTKEELKSEVQRIAEDDDIEPLEAFERGLRLGLSSVVELVQRTVQGLNEREARKKTA